MSTCTTYDIYHELINHLNPPTPRLLEIDILPSSLTSTIQYSVTDSAVGVSQKLLVQCFLRAREIFFSPSSLPSPTRSPQEQEGSGREDAGKSKFYATTILLLWDPNHTTAINYRKRYLLSNASGPHVSSTVQRAFSVDDASPPLNPLIHRELTLLESLLTSPLRKHTKSPTLWSHRLWLYNTFLLHTITTFSSAKADPSTSSTTGQAKEGRETMEAFWNHELSIVMKAGERHAANYYAWNYARDIYALFLDKRKRKNPRVRETDTVGRGSRRNQGCSERLGMEELRMLGATMRTVQAWCFRHPSDCSGWSFLGWLCCRCVDIEGGEDSVERVIEEVKGWRNKIGWTGPCVEKLMKEIGDLLTDGGDISA